MIAAVAKTPAADIKNDLVTTQCIRSRHIKDAWSLKARHRNVSSSSISWAHLGVDTLRGKPNLFTRTRTGQDRLCRREGGHDVFRQPVELGPDGMSQVRSGLERGHLLPRAKQVPLDDLVRLDLGFEQLPRPCFRHA